MYINLIEHRRSIRSFKNVPITESDLTSIMAFIDEMNEIAGPFGQKAEFQYFPVSNHINPEGQRIGTYGVIRNPAGYIIGNTKNSRESLIDYGYVFEMGMLRLLSIGIGTCWLGGTFDRKMLSEKFENNSSYIIPAITPLGYHDSSPSLIEKTMRMLANSDHKYEFADIFFKKDFGTPLSKEAADIYAIPFEMVRLGPSASNKQPWRLILDEDRCVHFFLAHTPNYGKRLNFDMQYLDMGIAMFHFQSAYEEIGLEGEWRVVEGLQVQVDSPHMEYVISWMPKAL